MPQGPPDQKPESIVLNAFSGVKNTVSRERLSPTDLVEGENIDLDDAGQPRRRRGFALKDDGSWSCVTTVGSRTFGVRTGMLVRIFADYSYANVTAAGGPVCFTIVDEDVYFSGSAVGIVKGDDTVVPWGALDEQNQWISPVVQPTNTLGAISGKLVGPPPAATAIEAYSGRIYMAVGKTLWATELFVYHLVDKTKNFMQFEHDITLVRSVADGLYVGTTGGLYFLQGVLGKFRLSTVTSAAVLPGSAVIVPSDLVHPNARNGPMPSTEAVVLMTVDGIVAGFDNGTAYNLTHDRVLFPQGVSAAALYRQDQGVSSYVAAVDSAGGPSANTRIGDYVDVEIIRASQGG